MQDTSSRIARGQRGQVHRAKDGKAWAVRYYDENGRRSRRAGFGTKEEASDWLRDRLDEVGKLRRGEVVPVRRSVPTLSELADELLASHPGERNTRATLRARLDYATRKFGDDRIDRLTVSDLAAWRRTLPERSASQIVKALRQALNYAAAERLIPDNPAARIANPSPKRREVRPFSVAELDAIAAELEPRWAPIPILVGLTGLRPSEWIALERADVDRQAGILRVRRVYVDGEVRPYGKQKGSLRSVALPARAAAALDALPPRLDTRRIFPGRGGDYLDLHAWRANHWYPALRAVGLEQRGPYALRHTFASLAIAAGVSVFELSRLMGTSAAMIDTTYAHLLPDTVERTRDRLDAFVEAAV
jgi:integrase